MSTQTSGTVILPLRNARGQTIADLHLWPTLKGEEDPTAETSSLFLITAAEAENQGQLPIQLRERGSYLYEIRAKSQDANSYQLREESGIRQSPRTPSEGWIDTRDFSGVLLLQLVTADDNETPVATGELEVRSLKLNYRQDYQAMLSRIAKESAALLFDHGSPTRHRLSEHWQAEPPLMQQQLEFLRDTLRSPRFQTAVEQILRSPHRRLRREEEDFRVNQLKKMDRSVVRQLTRGGGAREEIPTNHPLRQPGLRSLPLTVRAPVSSDDFDTAENRFVKMMLVEFRDFLEEIARALQAKAGQVEKPNLLLSECGRLQTLLTRHLDESLFQNLSRPTTLPFGSPVLQRKAGYRELYHLWLQFHANAQLAWDGGQELWKGGARNVASLYEYWLFFVLVDVFKKRFHGPQNMPSWLMEVREGIPHMKLKRGEGLVSDEHNHQTPSGNRRLKARFRFNHKFAHNSDPNVMGSWTRGVQPDYTFSIWPSAYSETEAEKNELMVHVHFDAKYRVDKLPGFTKGSSDDNEAINDIDLEDQRRTAPKYEDLLKMHAYRDAIRRTGGAYVLYPGNENSNQEPYKSFYHEILPGLGAFAIRPNKDGEATGVEGLTQFLDQIIEHLCNRTTAYEETRYHSGETRRIHEGTEVKYGAPQLPEKDPLFAESVALPPEEHRVVVGWYNSNEQLEWTSEKGIAIIRLGKRSGSFHVPPSLADARHLLLRTSGKAAPGLWRLTEQGFKVYTGAELASSHQYKSSRSNPDYIYAVFKVEADPAWANHSWDNGKLVEAIEEFESEKRNKPVVTLGRQSPYPRLISLRRLLKAASLQKAE